MKLITFVAFFVYFQSAFSGQFEDGQIEIDKGNYLKAYEILLPLAEKDHAQAQYTIGRLLTDSLISNKNAKEGVIWLEKAVKNHHMQAAQTLGRMYLSGFEVPLDTQKGAYYMTLAEEFRPPEEAEAECD